jgi:hypothetical protein
MPFALEAVIKDIMNPDVQVVEGHLTGHFPFFFRTLEYGTRVVHALLDTPLAQYRQSHFVSAGGASGGCWFNLAT